MKIKSAILIASAQRNLARRSVSAFAVLANFYFKGFPLSTLCDQHRSLLTLREDTSKSLVYAVPPHPHINKTFVFGLVAFANSAIPLYLSGELRFELRSQLRPRGLDSFTKFDLQKKSLFIFYIYYIIFFIKNQIISYWLPLWDSNPDNLLQRDITVLETGVLPLDEGAIQEVKEFFYFLYLIKILYHIFLKMSNN